MGSLEYFAFGMWQLWLDTNRFIFSQAITSLSECIYHTINLAREFHFLIAKHILKPPIIKYIKWNPSHLPFVTLNTNGSTQDNLGKVGAGGVFL